MNEAKVWTADEIKTNLQQNDWWVVRSVKAIFEKGQTADEQNSESTQHFNGVGFNGADAAILSSFAKQIIAWYQKGTPKYRFPLSPKQLTMARQRIMKYTRQLAEIANGNLQEA